MPTKKGSPAGQTNAAKVLWHVGGGVSVEVMSDESGHITLSQPLRGQKYHDFSGFVNRRGVEISNKTRIFGLNRVQVFKRKIDENKGKMICYKQLMSYHMEHTSHKL